MDNKTLIKQYVGIVQKIARVEHRRIPNHMIEYEELVSIGIIAIQTLIKDKTEEQLERYNDAYIGTAVRWAIRNELRHRYKWYTLKMLIYLTLMTQKTLPTIWDLLSRLLKFEKQSTKQFYQLTV